MAWKRLAAAVLACAALAGCVEVRAPRPYAHAASHTKAAEPAASKPAPVAASNPAMAY